MEQRLNRGKERHQQEQPSTYAHNAGHATNEKYRIGFRIPSQGKSQQRQ